MLRKEGRISLSETSRYCIIRLVLAIRRRAIEDHIRWRGNGRKGKSPWEEWKECECHYCIIKMVEILKKDHLNKLEIEDLVKTKILERN